MTVCTAWRRTWFARLASFSPTYKGDRLGPWSLRAGLFIYDALRLFRGQGHRYLNPERARAVEPLLGKDGLRGALWYEDAVTDDARLTLTVLQDAMRLGAEVLTYCPVKSIRAVDGNNEVECEAGTVRTKATVVATGPWTGEKLLGIAGKGALSLSKGVHVVVRASACPVRHPVVVQVPGQRRILFAVPWGSRTYLGTTDSAYEGDPGNSQVTPEDEVEVLQLVKRALPHATLEREAIVSVWSGIRPLVRPPGVAEGDTVELARTHRIIEGEPGVFGIVGGKLTTYRQMAEDVVDEVVADLRRRGRFDTSALSKCITADRPLVPGPADPRESLSSDRVQAYESLIADLELRHGAFTAQLLQKVAEQPELGEPLVEQLPYRRVEVQQAIRYEGVTHLVDLLRRRLPLALTDPRLGWGVAAELAKELADAWGGDQRFIDEQLEGYRERVLGETARDPSQVGA